MNKNRPFMFCALLVLAVCIANGGCQKKPLVRQESLPEIVWPYPPEQPRIRFIKSVARPDDLGISRGWFKRVIHYLGGKPERGIVTPYGVEADSAGRLYVVDTFLKIVHVFDIEKHGYYQVGTSKTSFVSPIDIAIDETRGLMYVTDSKDGVVKIFENQGKQFAGELGRGVLERPTGIAINEKTAELLIVDTLSGTVLRYDLNDHSLKGVFASAVDNGGKFHYPTNIAMAGDGTILVTDSLNFRILIFDSQGSFLKGFGSLGDGPGYFSRPKGIASDSNGNIYVVDALFDNVQIFDKEGRMLMSFGSHGEGQGEFWLPTGIFIDKNDTIYVSDSFNKRIQIFEYLKEGVP